MSPFFAVQGVRNIWVKGFSEPFEKADHHGRYYTAGHSYFWTRDSRYVLYVQDKGGDENFHIYAVDPAPQATPYRGA